MEAILSLRYRIKAPDTRTLDHRRVVRVGDYGTARMLLVRVADHAEQRLRLRLAVDHPVGVENLVPAVLRIGLREHHQLDVGGVAAGTDEVLDKIRDFVFRQREPHLAVGAFQRDNAAIQHIHRCERPGIEALEEPRRFLERREHGFRHAVVDQRQQRGFFLCRQRAGTAPGNPECNAALDALHRFQAAMTRDIGGFRGPW